MPVALRRPLFAAVAALLATSLAACGAGPRKASTTTVDAMVLERGVLVGESGDNPPGVRALGARQPKAISRFQTDLRSNLFGDGGETKLLPYLNGMQPLKEARDLEKEGAPDLAYAGDRLGWLVRDVSDSAATPTGIVGLFPAPFSTRFTKKRRLIPARIQCADVKSAACDDTESAFAKLELNAATSNLQDTSGIDVVRIYVGPWDALRPVFERGRLSAALTIETEGERNGYGFQMAADGASVRIAAPFGEAAPSTAPLGAGTGVIYALRDSIGAPVWVVTGTDAAGADRAAKSLDETTLAGRVAAVVPAG